MSSFRPPVRLPQVVKDSLLESEDELLRQVERSAVSVPEWKPRIDGILDRLERAIEDIGDPRLYREMRELLGELDSERAALYGAHLLEGVNVHRALDPIRIALRDLEAGLV